MLQQTQVNRVVPKYLEFMEAFPILRDLAEADTKRLLQVWSGLGYNRRVLWLRKAAQQILELGEFPSTVKDLRKLKGIGPYTSRSILIFAFNQDIATIDTNIRRVLIANEFAEESSSETELQRIAESVLLKGRSSDWHNALMDYGSMVQTAKATGIAPTSSQPKFTGSTRQLRGALVRIISCTDYISYQDLLTRLHAEDLYQPDVDEIIDQLIEEGFLERTAESNLRIAEC